MKHSFLLLALFIGFSVNAQTLFTVDGEPTTVEEFKTMYEKNNQEKPDYDSKSLEENLNLFVNYKLKLKEAEAQRLIEDPAIKAEIEGYEQQLIRSTFDKAIMQKLLEEAYQRSKEEICVSHVMLNVRNNATPEDTLLVYNAAVKIRNRALQGEDFAALAKRYSADIDSKLEGGDLGCFTALQVSIYDIENAAYKLKKGEISMPVRTRLGYHLFKMNDRRPSSGEVTAAHIFTRSNATLDKEVQDAALTTIYEAYNKLKDGDSFGDIAQAYSEDPQTKNANGQLAPFTVGTYASDFENAIFNIKREGDYTEPVKTSVGWHIFKLVKKSKQPTLEELEPELRTQIAEDERYELSRRTYSNSLKAKYKFASNEENIDSFTREVAPGITLEGWQIPSSYPLSNELFTMDNMKYSARDFVNYVKAKHSEGRFLSFRRYYLNYESEKLLNYHKQKMIENDPSMLGLLKEYKDGTLLFNLMDKEIWSKSKPADAVLEQFYNANKSNYNRPDKVKAYVIIPATSKASKKLKKLVRKDASMATIELMEDLTVNKIELERDDATIGGKDLWMIGTMTSRLSSIGGMEYIKSYGLAAGVSNPFSKIKDRVLADFRKSNEEEWIGTLKNKYAVEINQEAFEKLVK